MGTYKKRHYIGTQLQEALKEKKVTVTKFASDIGINRVTIQNYMADKKTPSIKTIEKFADYFDVPVEYFTEPAQRDLPSLMEKMNETVDEYKVKAYNVSAMNAYDQCFKEADTQKKIHMVTKLFDLCIDIKESEKTINLAEDSATLQRIKTIYERYYISISKEQIQEKIKRNPETDSILKSKYKSYLEGIEQGVLMSLSQQEYKRYNDLNALRDLFYDHAFDEYESFILVSIEYYLDDLTEKKKNRVEGIRQFIQELQIPREPAKPFGSNASLYFDTYKERLLKIDIDLFELAVAPVFDFGNHNIEQAIQNLNNLADAIENKEI